MTSQYDFSNDQWKLVATTPLLVGMAVARAEDSGLLGSFRETRTLLGQLEVDGVEHGESSVAPSSLIAQAAAYDHESDYQVYKSMPADALAGDAERACRQLTIVLGEVAEPTEAQAYKQWVLGLARQVAKAAREDGVRVSPGETSVIAAVEAALEIESSGPLS